MLHECALSLSPEARQILTFSEQEWPQVLKPQKATVGKGALLYVSHPKQENTSPWLVQHRMARDHHSVWQGKFFCGVELGFELRALHLLSRCSTALATPPVHFPLVIFWRWGSCELFAPVGLEPWSSQVARIMGMSYRRPASATFLILPSA
jgi:hypothetical protein